MRWAVWFGCLLVLRVFVLHRRPTAVFDAAAAHPGLLAAVVGVVIASALAAWVASVSLEVRRARRLDPVRAFVELAYRFPGRAALAGETEALAALELEIYRCDRGRDPDGCLVLCSRGSIDCDALRMAPWRILELAERYPDLVSVVDVDAVRALAAGSPAPLARA